MLACFKLSISCINPAKHLWLTYSIGVATSTPNNCVGASPTVDGYALPIDRALIAANPSMLDQPHHDS